VPEGDWFDLSGFSITTNQIARLRGELPERLNLVAKMGSADGRTHGVAPGFTAPFACANVTPTGGCDWWEQAGQRDRSGWQTVWSKQRIPETSRALFVSVFAPYTATGGRAAAKAIADGIAVKTAGDGATVTLTPQGAAAALTVTLEVHGAWSVQGRGGARRGVVRQCTRVLYQAVSTRPHRPRPDRHQRPTKTDDPRVAAGRARCGATCRASASRATGFGRRNALCSQCQKKWGPTTVKMLPVSQKVGPYGNKSRA
jgi:hypothetical protein